MKHRYLKNVVTLMVDRDKCTGCRICLDVCPHDVLEIQDKLIAIRDRDACMECGACARNCPFEAITVQSGVGCAAAIIRGALTGTEPTCGCSDSADGGNSGCC
ncbi:MAG: mercury methylation ferredoxin HgcB [Methylocystaceae bacterium]